MNEDNNAVLQKSPSIIYREPKINCHSFHTTVADTKVLFEVYRLKDSVFIWIGQSSNRTFYDLCLALTSKFSINPLSTKIMGEPTDMASNTLSSKLSKKLNKPVYVSFNLSNDRLTLQAVDKRLNEEISMRSNKF